MLFLDGFYISGKNGTSARFRRVKAPTGKELTQLTHTIAQRTARYLERQGLLERDGENSYLTSYAGDNGPMDQLLEHSITYRIAVGPQQGCKVFTLQTLPDCSSDNPVEHAVGKVAGFSLHAGVAAKAHERAKLERLCRYFARPAVSTKRLSLTRNGQVRFELKTPRKWGPQMGSDPIQTPQMGSGQNGVPKMGSGPQMKNGVGSNSGSLTIAKLL